jgi:hypothetical protein
MSGNSNLDRAQTVSTKACAVTDGQKKSVFPASPRYTSHFFLMGSVEIRSTIFRKVT